MKTACLLLLSGLFAAAHAQTKPAPPRSAQAAHQAVQAHKASIGQKFVKHSKPNTMPDIPRAVPVQPAPLK